MKFQTILFEIENNIAKIRLHRPEANNSVNLQMAKDLMYASMKCSEDSKVKAVIITGEGKSFCPGGDLKSFAEEKESLAYHLREITTHIHAAISRFTRMDAPLIIAVNGVAAGAGMSIACAGDFVLAAESAWFTMAYTRIGLSPDAGVSYFLPRLVGIRRAVELAATNRRVYAQEAMEMGLITRVIPDSQLISEAESLAAGLAAAPTYAISASKRLMHSGFYETLETQMELESQQLAGMANNPETRRLINDFFENRRK